MQQIYQNYLDKSTPYTTYRWIATATIFILFGLRIVFAQGWYIGTSERRRIARARVEDNARGHPTNHNPQSPTPSASTCSTSSSPSSRPNSTPALKPTPTWRTACPQASLHFLPRATRSSSPSSAACLSSSSGTLPPAPFALLSPAVGVKSSTCPSSGPFLLYTG